MRGLKGGKTSANKAGAGSSSHHAGARSASHGTSKALGVDPLTADEIKADYPPKGSSAAQSPRSTSSGAASPVPTPGGGNDPDTPKSRLLHSVMGALEAYASSASDQPPAHHQPYHAHLHQPPSSSASSPARARSGASLAGLSSWLISSFRIDVLPSIHPPTHPLW